jgi:xylulokinase
MPETILVVDVGLTNCKAIIFSRAGCLSARASVAYPTYHPQPGWVEQDPEEWWAALLSGLRQLQAAAPEALSAVEAISVTGHMHALVCMGTDGAALGRSLVLGDQRSLAGAETILAELGLEQIYTLTGARMDASMPLAKLRWLRSQSPEIHRQAHAFLACKDWLRHRLTGDCLTDPIDACGTSLYDIQRREWSPELIGLAGVRPAQLPEVADPCAIAGHLSPAAAQAMGLRAGIPVVVGAGDDVEVLGNGLLGPGASLEHLGTTGSILTCADRPVYDPLMALELYPHVASGLWVLGGSVTAAGSALAWAEQVLCPDASSALASLGRPNLEQPLIFIPHLTGERCPDWEPRMRGSWVGLSPTHTAADLHRAVLEGIAFSLKSVLDRIESLVGPQAQITVSGREVVNERWLALRAGVYGRPLALLKTSDPTALGAMILGAVGVGLYGSLAEAVQHVTGSKGLIEPQAGLIGDYEQLYDLYRAASEAIRPLLRRRSTGRRPRSEVTPCPT